MAFARLAATLVLVGLLAATVFTPSHEATADDSSSSASSLSPAFTIQSFCNSPAGRSLKCGWATEGEQFNSTAGFCVWCGVGWMAEPPLSLPATLQSTTDAYQVAGHVISLGCVGPVVVRAVFKVLQQPDMGGRDCAPARLDVRPADSGPTIRCELRLPPGPEPEEQRAVRMEEEGNCYKCTACWQGGGCPSKVGVWYSDSYTTAAMGCEGAVSAGDYYYPQKAGITVWKTTLRLAKFEVCGAQPCFDPVYEARKASTAKECSNGVCPP